MATNSIYNNGSDLQNTVSEGEPAQNSLAPPVVQRRRFTAAEISTLRDFLSRGMLRKGALFDECISALGVSPTRVKNWITNNSRSSGRAGQEVSTNLCPPPVETVTSLQRVGPIFKPARGRKPSVRDVFQKQAGRQLRDSGTLKGGQASIAQVDALATELQQSASAGELENARSMVAAKYGADEVQQMENAERQQHLAYHQRMMRNHSNASAQLGLASVVVTIDTKDKKLDIATYGNAASDFESKFEEVVGCNMTTLFATTTVGTGRPIRDAQLDADSLANLRKKVQTKMRQAINDFLSAKHKRPVARLPISAVEKKCLFLFTNWPEVPLNPSRMRMSDARSILGQNLDVVACDCHPE